VDVVTNFRTIVDRVKRGEKKTVVVAAADEQDVLAATVQAKQEGLADFLYVGKAEGIYQCAAESQIDISGVEVLDASDSQEAARKALELLKAGKGHVLMKGKISTNEILGMVLKDEDLKKNNQDQFLSHVSIFEWEHRLKIFSDPALNIAPNIQQKRRIALNALGVAQKLGINAPRVAFLSAIETVNPKIPSSVEAAELANMEWGAAIAAGPLAFDGALFAEAYRIKGITSPAAGNADILIFPNIEAANTCYKVLAWMLKLNLAGVIVGAAVPFILTSRADSAWVKFLSIATTIYLAG